MEVFQRDFFYDGIDSRRRTKLHFTTVSESSSLALFCCCAGLSCDEVFTPHTSSPDAPFEAFLLSHGPFDNAATQ